MNFFDDRSIAGPFALAIGALAVSVNVWSMATPKFHEVTETQTPPEVLARYGTDFIHRCHQENSQP